MNTKEKATKEILKKIFESSTKLIMSKKDIKKIETYYKKNSSKFDNVDDFIASNEKIGCLVNRLKSGKDEIGKQLKAKKALQPGVLYECVVAQTCAKAMGLRNYVDLETTPISKTPKEAVKYIKESRYTACAARYAYYKKSDDSNAVVQYGNPAAGDMGIAINGQECKIEIKDMPALLMDKDIIYDEDGKIIITDEIKSNYPGYVKYIQEFNSKTSMIDKMGSNYKLFDDGDTKAIGFVKSFLDSSDIDIIMTATNKDELIGLTPELIDYTFSDNTPLITVAGSEIRTTGKNSLANAFTPQYLNKILNEKDIAIEDGMCRVKANNRKVIGWIHGRGKDKDTATRFKISNAFFVKSDDIIVDNDYVKFPKEKIRQSKGGISLHISIKHTKKEIGNVILQASKNINVVDDSIPQIA